MSEPVVPAGAVNFRRTRPGLYRSADLKFLSGTGHADLQGLQLSRIIDLRDRHERQVDPPPCWGKSEYLNLPLLPWRTAELNSATARAASNADLYRASLDFAPNQIVTVLGAVLDAPQGPVLLHCHAGKGRTGLLVALCGALAGQDRQTLAANYARSGRELVDIYAGMRRRIPPERWAALAPFVATRPQDLLDALDHLDRRWGGIEAYLSAYGLTVTEQQALAARLRAEFRGMEGGPPSL